MLLTGPSGPADRPVLKRALDGLRTMPEGTPTVAAMQAAGRGSGRVYDGLVVTDELNRCLGIVRVSDLIRHVAWAG
ncbi:MULTISPECIES: hypothetical protein [unclassified Nonomuraea]|uniref:hypothetical protein n=1 Tax=unclassified Nonomuraea TaxID=2593643 RepID=UPI00340AEABC